MSVAQMDVNLLKEMLKLKLSLLPLVSDKEMEEINRDVGDPQNYEEEKSPK